MSFKAIKNFEINGQKFNIGDTVPNELIEERLIRSKKVKSSEEDFNGLITETPNENIIIEVVKEIETPTIPEQIVEQKVPELTETKNKNKAK